MSRWEKLVNRKWNELIDHDKWAASMSNVSQEEKERVLRDKKMLTGEAEMEKNVADILDYYKKSIEVIKEKINESKKLVRDLKVGDVLTSGAEIASSPSAGLNTPAGKVEIVIKYPNGSKKLQVWNKNTSVTLKSVSEDGTSLYTTSKGTVDEIEEMTKKVHERVISFMPKSDAVEVKRNCQVGGKKNGTSDACNQGDIKNLKLKKIS